MTRKISLPALLGILLAAAATWILPGGSYQRQKENVGGTQREIVLPGTYNVEPSRQDQHEGQPVDRPTQGNPGSHGQAGCRNFMRPFG